MMKTNYINSHSIMSKLVLDTHVFIWLMESEKKLSARNIEIINNHALNNTLYVPVICLWEIAFLNKCKRIQLNQPCAQWLHEATNKPGLSVVPLSLDIIMESVAISDNVHADPSDRFIIATARVLNAKLMTRDSKILQYGENGLIQCIEG